MIVFPMMGLSSRFTLAGYDVPKYMLPTKFGSVFRRSVESFNRYYESEEFLFIAREGEEILTWLQGEIEEIGNLKYSIVQLPGDTLGQGHTVKLGLDSCKVNITDSLTVFNIDTFRPDFLFSDLFPRNSNWLEVFRGSGDHWSFIEPGNGNLVVRTTEKERISEYCSDGIYGFSSIALFQRLVQDALDARRFVRGELYIAPLYNQLIERGDAVYYKEIDKSEIIFSGTPVEYEELLKSEL